MITPNIASHLTFMALQQPDTHAVVVQSISASDKSDLILYKNTYTYKELDEISNMIANGLRNYGIAKGMRTVLMVKPGLDFFALIFALFKLEAVLVAVDPGMGIKNLGKCLAEAESEAFIGISSAHIARLTLGWAKKTISKTVLVGNNLLLARTITTLEKIKASAKDRIFENKKTVAEDMAAILFTSGSTGIPKGVVYTHANFTAQHKALKNLYNIQKGEIDLATFPLFALFAPALGMTSIIPKMNFTRPGLVNSKTIIDAVNDYQCTMMFGSPALLNRVGKWGEANEKKLPTLKRVLSAGAPVSATVLKRFISLLNNDVQIFTPYGATESLPVSSVGTNVILNETAKATSAGKGVCVGTPVSCIDTRIIKITDDVITTWGNELELNANQIGEICVSGPQVTKSYFNRDNATILAKIKAHGKFYHRMGDIGYLDNDGRLWFCGRKSQRVITDTETLYTICCEGIFNKHESVFRSALVGIKQENKTIPVICVELELEHKSDDRKKLTKELLELGRHHLNTKNIKKILFHSGFPVDIRHNAKIGREKLSKWAEEKLS